MKKMNFVFLWLSALLIGCLQTTNSGINVSSKLKESDSSGGIRVTTVFVVRHAEKASEGTDPDLTVSGLNRAKELRTRLGVEKIDAVFATNYRRTRQTADLTASDHAITTNTDFETTIGLAKEILNNRQGQTVLVAGHSNTVPLLLKALGIKERVVIEHDDYGDLFIVTIDTSGKAKLTREHFGN